MPANLINKAMITELAARRPGLKTLKAIHD